VEDYVRFYQTKVYLYQKSGKLIYYKNNLPEIRKLAEKAGYKDLNSFLKHREEWHELKRKIPLSYLEALGVDLKVVQFTVELDVEEYEQAIQLPLYPRCGIARLIPAAYCSISLPEGTARNYIPLYLNPIYGLDIPEVYRESAAVLEEDFRQPAGKENRLSYLFNLEKLPENLMENEIKLSRYYGEGNEVKGVKYLPGDRPGTQFFLA